MLNVDGSCLENPGITGFGGLLHSGEGDWKVGFYVYLGVADNLMAELVALLHGLRVAWGWGIRHILVYSDSQVSITLISQPVQQHHRYASIISRFNRA